MLDATRAVVGIFRIFSGAAKTLGWLYEAKMTATFPIFAYACRRALTVRPVRTWCKVFSVTRHCAVTRQSREAHGHLFSLHLHQ